MEELKKLLNDWWNKWGYKGEKWKGKWSYEEYKKDFQQLIEALFKNKFKKSELSNPPFSRKFNNILSSIENYHNKESTNKKENLRRQAEKEFILYLLSGLEKKEYFAEVLYEDKNLYSPKGLTADLALVFGNLNSSQLRKIFDSFKKLKNSCEELKKWEGKKESEGEKLKELFKNVYEIYPLLAYAKGRKLIPDEFHKLLVYLLGRVEKYRDESLKHPPKCYLSNLKNELCNLVAFIHSFLAYHKFYHANK